MDNFAHYLTRFDFTLGVYILTWTSTILMLVLVAKTGHDPASSCVGCWCQRLRRFGLVIVQGAFMTAILFGDELKWTPWPPMLLALVGLNLYYAASIVAVQERINAHKNRMVPAYQ